MVEPEVPWAYYVTLILGEDMTSQKWYGSFVTMKAKLPLQHVVPTN